MKKTLTYFSTLLSIAFLLVSCGGNKDDDKSTERKVGDYNLAVDKAMNGDLSSDFEVTKAVLKVEKYGAKLLVEVKRTSSEFAFNVEHAKFDHEGVADSLKYDVQADILGESDVPVETSLSYASLDPFVKLRSLKKGETLWLEFSASRVDDPSKAKKVKLTSSLEKYIGGSTASSDSNDSGDSEGESEMEGDEEVSESSDCDEIASDFEALADEAVTFAKELKENPKDLSLIAEKSSFAAKFIKLKNNSSSCATDPSTGPRIKKAIQRITSGGL
jgi:hypothetical protein